MRSFHRQFRLPLLFWSAAFRLALALLAVAGCGGGSPDTANGLYINAALGVTLVQSPIAAGPNPEGALKAVVVVSRDKAQVQQVAATLTVNGVEVPQQTLAGAFIGYDFRPLSVPIQAGDTLTLHAAFADSSAELILHCPPGVTITAPTDGSQASAGDSVTVRWSGTVDHATFIKPDIIVRGFDPASGSSSDIGFADRSEKGKSQDAIVLPDTRGAPQWLVDLYVPGDLADGAAGTGFCMLDRRVHIVKR